MPTHIAIAGILGRMGQEITVAGHSVEGVQIVAGVVRPGALARLNGGRPDVPLVEHVEEILPAVDVLVDFTSPEATVAHARACAGANTPFVSGVTGLSANQSEALRDVAAVVPVFHARNMSVGLNALLGILPGLIRALDGYDVEIVETHHRHKADAPSGTALALAEAILSARGANLAERAIYGRQGVAPRTSGELGIHAVRAGGNSGEHVILLADEGEEIRVAHRAYSRRTFAMGALRAARFVAGRPPGLYAMADLTTVP
ncbi:MAG: 4-hydroxy-tetrahydrodipicolinate reductase [Thermomicrobiales bacterium]